MQLEDSTKKSSNSVNCWLILRIWDEVAIILAAVYGVSQEDYLIFYRPIDGGVEVARILSGYQDLETIFSKEDIP